MLNTKPEVTYFPREGNINTSPKVRMEVKSPRPPQIKLSLYYPNQPLAICYSQREDQWRNLLPPPQRKFYSHRKKQRRRKKILGNVETPQGLTTVKVPLRKISNHKTSSEEGMEMMVASAITNISNASLKALILDSEQDIRGRRKT